MVRDLDGNSVRIEIAFDRLPPKCSACSHFGHLHHRCPSLPRKSLKPSQPQSSSQLLETPKKIIFAPVPGSLSARSPPPSPLASGHSSVQAHLPIQSVQKDPPLCPSSNRPPLKPKTSSRPVKKSAANSSTNSDRLSHGPPLINTAGPIAKSLLGLPFPRPKLLILLLLLLPALSRHRPPLNHRHRHRPNPRHYPPLSHWFNTSTTLPGSTPPCHRLLLLHLSPTSIFLPFLTSAPELLCTQPRLQQTLSTLLRQFVQSFHPLQNPSPLSSTN